MRKIGYPNASKCLYTNLKSQQLTCHMQVQCCSFRSIVILPRRRHSVDPHSSVDVFDAILNGAHVGVGESMAVSEVQRDARPCAVALHKERKKTKQLFSNTHHIFSNFTSAGAVFQNVHNGLMQNHRQTKLHYNVLHFIVKINIYN